jgi:hypothetical protein
MWVDKTGSEPWSVMGFRWIDLRLFNYAVPIVAVIYSQMIYEEWSVLNEIERIQEEGAVQSKKEVKYIPVTSCEGL